MTETGNKRLLVAVDGSEQAFATVRYVGRMMSGRQVEVTLFHVVTRVPESFWDIEKEPAYRYRIVSVGAWEVQQEKIILEFMERAQRELTELGIPEGAVRVKIEDRKEGTARDIAAEAAKGYDAVVVGRRGMSDLKDLMLGNIASKIVEKVSKTPIWVVGGAAPPEKFLVGMDNSQGAMLAVDHLASMIQDSHRYRVRLFHAMRGLNVFQKAYGELFLAEDAKNLLDGIGKELDEVVRLMKPTFEEAVRRLVEGGLALEMVDHKVVTEADSRGGAIVEEAEREGFDTIVIGRRGMSKVQDFFMGRVSNKVIHLAKEKTVWVVS